MTKQVDLKFKKVVAISGYFDPIHIGHIEYFQKAKELGDRLVVIVNTDKQANLKKGFAFMPLGERIKILEAIKYIDKVVVSIDVDKTVCRTLEILKPDIFAKGGDRTLDNIPEKKICERLGIEMVFSVGKKIQSSSNLINKVKQNEL